MYKDVIYCWFCKENLGDKEVSVSKTIYKVIDRFGIINRGVQYSYKDVIIPRCESCEEIHSNIKNILTNDILIGLGVGFVLGLFGALIFGKNVFILAGTIPGGLIGWMFGEISRRKILKQQKIKSFSTSVIYNVMREHLRMGWTLVKPSA